MRGSKLAGLVLLACAVTIATPQFSGAQFGGLIKKKVIDKAKKAAGGDAESEEANKPASGEPAAEEPANRSPDVFVLSDTVVAALEKGLQTELRLREELKKELEAKISAVKTPEQYKQCSQQVPLSPEAMQIAERFGNLPENAPPEQMQKAVMQMAKDLEALVLKTCGPDPQPILQSIEEWRDQRLTEIKKEAAAAAGPIK